MIWFALTMSHLFVLFLGITLGKKAQKRAEAPTPVYLSTLPIKRENGAKNNRKTVVMCGYEWEVIQP